MSLPALPPITRLEPGLVRVLGQNPSPFTLQGTNLYFIGTILIDTGSGHPDVPPLARQALADLGNDVITDIILTHHHPDHVDGLPSLEKVLNPSKLRVWKIPNQHSCDTWSSLKHLQRFSLSSSSSPEEYLQVRHTPGHTSDSICLLWYRDSNLQAIFTADTVLGHGSAVFENLSEYMASLTLLEGVLTAAQGKVPLYPGHGEVRRDGLDTVKEYKKHRIEREEQIVRSLRVDGPATVDE